MGKPTDAQRGIGNITDVAAEYARDDNDEGRYDVDVRDAATALINLMDTPPTRRAALALACAVINSYIRDTHWICVVTDRDTPDYQPVSSEYARNALIESAQL